jgi:hypothetical protein
MAVRPITMTSYVVADFSSAQPRFLRWSTTQRRYLLPTADVDKGERHDSRPAAELTLETWQRTPRDGDWRVREVTARSSLVEPREAEHVGLEMAERRPTGDWPLPRGRV